jgi:hypothetical protein
MVFLLVARRTGAFVSNSRRVLLSTTVSSSVSQWQALYSTAVNAEELERKIKVKGDEIRQLKEDGVDKTALAPHVEELLALKAQLPQTEEPKKKKKPEKKQSAKQVKKKPEEMSESELRQARLAKVAAMRESGVEPFEYNYKPTHTAAELQAQYEGRLEGGEEDESADAAVAGRIMVRRVFGKLAFFTLQDESGTIQLHLEKNRLGDSFEVRYLQVTVIGALSQHFLGILIQISLD